MINRASHPLTYDNLKSSSLERETKITKLNENLSKGQKISNLRDDPTGVTHAIRLDSDIFRSNKYVRNIGDAKANLRYTEGYLQSLTQILSRAKELAVQGANGTYEAEDKKMIAREVNALLEDVVEIANVKGGNGYSLFAGTKIDAVAFKISRANQNGEGNQIVKVNYNGDQAKTETEIYNGIYVSHTYPGNELFFIENHSIKSAVDANGFTVGENTKIYIDNTEITLIAGDTVADIISKINESAVAVEASIDPTSNSLQIQTTKPHQIWITESEGSTVMQDLGIITRNNPTMDPPYNIAENAEIIGRSIFDALIELRDNLFENREELVGSRNLAEVDESLSSVLASISDLGAKENRLDRSYERLTKEVIDMTEYMASYTDLDITAAMSDLNMTTLAHQVSLGVSARIMQTSLLDFLK